MKIIKNLIAMSPVLPHFSNECLKLINQSTSSIQWPEINKKLIEEQVLNYVIQIGGKKEV